MQRSRCFQSRLLFATMVVLLSLLSSAQAPAPPIHQRERFVKQEVMIPMRDGVCLETVIFTPKQPSGPLPILLRRTPYGVPESERGLDSGIYEDLIADGYIFVSQNIRGRFKSEGTFMLTISTKLPTLTM